MEVELVFSLAAVILAGGLSAQTNPPSGRTVLTLGFEPAPLRNGSRLVAQAISERFQAVPMAKFGHADDNISAALPRNGSAFLQLGMTTRDFTLSRLDGTPFDVLGMGLAECSIYVILTAPVVFTGRRGDGGTVEQSFALDRVIDGSGPWPISRPSASALNSRTSFR